jgi:Thioredoxin reductase
LILEKGAIGGRAYTTGEIVNYPGIEHISGPDLTKAMADHAMRFGVEIIKEVVKGVDFSKDIKVVRTRRHEYTAKAVIIATGTSARVLGIPRREGINWPGRRLLCDVRRGIFQRQACCRRGKRRSGDRREYAYREICNQGIDYRAA